jgi:DNA-binding CsgD family transcriptional regulator
MAEIRQIGAGARQHALDAAYEGLLAVAGSDRLGPELQRSLGKLCTGVRRTYLFVAETAGESDLRYVACEPELRALLPTYARRFLARDPIADAYRAAPRHGDFVLQRIRPHEVACEDLRRLFFENGRIVERISLVRRSERSWQGINLARHEDTGPFAECELDQVVSLARLALPMLDMADRAAAPPGVGELERRFAVHGRGLTRREREVCARAAVGMTVEAAALDLGISRTSVLTYRQRAYLRLGVTSPIELRALVTR